MMSQGYYFIKSEELKYIWFVVPKAGSRTVRNYLIRQGHVPEVEKLQHYDDSLYQYYYKFAFVRNPWSRLVSAWNDKSSNQNDIPSWRIYSKYADDFDGFLRDVCDDNVRTLPGFEGGIVERHVRPQVELIPVEHADYIGKCETLRVDLHTICQHIKTPIENITQAGRVSHKHYTEYYDDYSRAMVNEKYAKDIEYFGYKFGE